jgi:hypothetical protein
VRRLPRGLTLASALLIASPALGDPAPKRPPPEPAPQKELRDEAMRLVGQGKLADARDIHMSLWRLGKGYTDAFNVGMISSRIRDFATAAEFLTIYFDLVGPLESPKVWIPRNEKTWYEKARVELAQALEHVGTLDVQVGEPGAVVLVDGREVGEAPLRFPVFVEPGQHRLAARRGGARAEEVVAVSAGATQRVRLVLHDAPAGATAPRAGGARGVPLPPPPLSGSGPRWLLPVGILAGTSAALGIFGGVAAGMANDAAGERDEAFIRARHARVDDCPGSRVCDDFTAADGRAKTVTSLAVVSLAGAGAAAVGAATVYLITRTDPVRVRATISIGGLRVAW